jgi:hypothetical protein
MPTQIGRQQLQTPAIRFTQLTRNKKPETSTFVMRGEKRLKNLLSRRFRNPRAIIGDMQFYALTPSHRRSVKADATRLCL